MTGIFLATTALDLHFHDTYFVVAHFHYVMVGGTLMAIVGGIYYWFPKMFNKMIHEGLGQISFFLIFVGFNVTFFPQFVLGAMGMPRRYFDYLPEYQHLNRVSSIGSYISAFGVLIFLVMLAEAFMRKRRDAANPWGEGATTLEWTLSSPPPFHQFNELPVVKPDLH